VFLHTSSKASDSSFSDWPQTWKVLERVLATWLSVSVVEAITHVNGLRTRSAIATVPVLDAVASDSHSPSSAPSTDVSESV
jgi:hypothetical protein